MLSRSPRRMRPRFCADDRKLGFAILTNGDRAHVRLFKMADRAVDLLKNHTNQEIKQ
jgi:hypothetical protein